MRMGVVLLLALAGCGGTDGGDPGSQAAAPPAGEKTYLSYCFSCHAAGIAGAPTLGVLEAWEPRFAIGRAALLAATIEGMPPGMPPRGLCMDCSDETLAEVIDYMTSRSGG
jgi:cytochrome c5